MEANENNCISGATSAEVNSQYDFFKLIGVTENGEMFITSKEICALIEELKLHRKELEKLNCLLGTSIVKIKRNQPCKGC